MARLSSAVKRHTSKRPTGWRAWTFWRHSDWRPCEPGLSFITPVELAMASTPDEREHDTDKAVPIFDEAAMQRLQVMHGHAKMRHGENRQQHHHDHRRDRYQESQASRVLGSEIIERRR